MDSSLLECGFVDDKYIHVDTCHCDEDYENEVDNEMSWQEYYCDEAPYGG